MCKLEFFDIKHSDMVTNVLGTSCVSIFVSSNIHQSNPRQDDKAKRKSKRLISPNEKCREWKSEGENVMKEKVKNDPIYSSVSLTCPRR